LMAYMTSMSTASSFKLLIGGFYPIIALFYLITLFTIPNTVLIYT
jgi:hypothetical protein